MKKIEQMLILKKYWRIRNPGGPIDLFHLLNSKIETIRKSQKQQREKKTKTSGGF